MAKYSFLKNSFLGGEISPRAYGRSETDIYRSTCEKIENMVVFPQGGVGRRPGTEFISSEVLEALPGPGILHTSLTQKCRIIPYIRSKTESYCILIRANTDASAYTQTTNCDIFVAQTSSSEDGATAYRQDAQLSGTHLRYKLRFYEASWIENYGGVSAIPNAKQFAGYSEDQIADIKFVTFGDFIILVHPEVPPLIIQYLGNAVVGSFVAYPFYLTPSLLSLGLGSSTVDTVSYVQGSWPFRATNANAAHTLSFSGTTGSVTVTSSKSFFDAAHIGAMFILSADGWFEITAVTNSVSATARVITTLNSASATANWKESSWSDYRGWPRTVCYHQSRAIYGGNVSEPQTLWGTKINGFLTLYTGTAGDTDPINLPIDSDDINEIQWLVSGKNLNIGTRGREYITFPRDDSQSLSTTNIKFSPESASGSSYVQPVRVGNAVTFIDRDNRTSREFVFNFQEDSFRADVLSLLSEHMVFKSADDHEEALDPAIIRMAWQGGQNSCMWYVDNNGGLFACTRVRELNINAWHYHKLGGTLQDEQCKVEDVCVVPNLDGTHDDVWVIVKRTIQDTDVRMIERIPQQYRRTDLSFNPVSVSIFDVPALRDRVMSYCDSQYTSSMAIELSADPVSSFSWFDHLAGETVELIGDGKYLGQTEVTSAGVVATPEPVARIIVGLPYRAILTTMPLDIGSAIGSGQTQIQRIDQVSMRFERAVGAKFGRDEDNLEEIIFRENSVAMDSFTPLFTGVKTQELRSIYSRDQKITVVSDLPLPFGLAAIAMRGVTYDGG